MGWTPPPKGWGLRVCRGGLRVGSRGARGRRQLVGARLVRLSGLPRMHLTPRHLAVDHPAHRHGSGGSPIDRPVAIRLGLSRLGLADALGQSRLGRADTVSHQQRVYRKAGEPSPRLDLAQTEAKTGELVDLRLGDLPRAGGFGAHGHEHLPPL